MAQDQYSASNEADETERSWLRLSEKINDPSTIRRFEMPEVVVGFDSVERLCLDPSSLLARSHHLRRVGPEAVWASARKRNAVGTDPEMMTIPQEGSSLGFHEEVGVRRLMVR